MKLFLLSLCTLSAAGFTVRRQTTGICDNICDDTNPLTTSLCGSDDVTYKSGCDFGNANCLAYHAGKRLYVQNPGECITTNTPCDKVMATHCTHINNNPLIVQGSTAADHTHQICGSDGKTYPSNCVFMQTMCSHKLAGSPTTLTVDHTGPCNGVVTNGSRSVDCSPYILDTSGLALETGSTTLTVDPTACRSVPHNYVCWNGRTYPSTCQFCQIMAHMHKITAQNLSASITNDGICTHNGGLVGK